MRALFVINRRSGLKRRDVRRVIEEGCTWDYSIAECEEKEDLDWIIAEAAQSVDVVVAVGGDGTVHEVAKRLIGTPMALGILPTGSGNGLARHIGLPMDPRQSLRACSAQRIVEIDTATVNGMPFLGTMGIGFDAWVAEQFATSRTRGLRTYVAVALRGLIHYSASDYDIDVDGQRDRHRALIVAIANSSQYGNNARIAPLASLQDGILEVVVVERVSALAIPRLFAGTLHQAAGVRMMRGRHIEIRRPAAGAAHLDGEAVTMPAELIIDVVPRSLHILLPDRVDRL